MNIRAQIYGGSKAEDSILRTKRPKGAKADALKSVAVPREESRRSNSRIADRHRLSQENVRATCGGASHEVELINLSGGGAMVRAPFEAKLWDRVDLHLGDNGTVECAVCWVRDNQIGLEFAHETRLDCSTDELANLLREVIARSFPDLPLQWEAEIPPVQRSAEDGENNRAELRHPLIWTGTLHFDFDSTPVRIRNISVSGAMIECDALVPIGSEPVLELNDQATLSTTARWACGDQVGLSFHAPFDMRLLSLSKPQVAPAKWTPPSYLDPSAAHSDSPWDPHWNRLTLDELGEQLEGFLKR